MICPQEISDIYGLKFKIAFVNDFNETHKSYEADGTRLTFTHVDAIYKRYGDIRLYHICGESYSLELSYGFYAYQITLHNDVGQKLAEKYPKIYHLTNY